ncbi:uncharacterized protein B0H64DRAFT_75890 [Chaetomium fimeti]|uniref:Uncharacterized protein n=1 Tax=Chaetomium fimeti TaxID=1854472 RepID=A0AAE0HL03_9PEZI|nr:hypothetical protein B0H64DRAFT_75890 [Chaetomium fimeti]
MRRRLARYPLSILSPSSASHLQFLPPPTQLLSTMQLSTALLSAMALFAQAASAFYLSSPSNHADPKAYAGLRDWTGNSVGFYKDAHKTANISLDSKGDIAQSGFKFQHGDFQHEKLRFERGNKSRTYLLVSTEGNPPRPNDLTGPFAIEDGKFVYKGGGDWSWNLAGLLFSDPLNDQPSIYLQFGLHPVEEARLRLFGPRRKFRLGRGRQNITLIAHK